MRIALSSGHGLKIRGARGNPVPPQLDEVDQARRVVDRVAELLGCPKFHDDVSTTQSDNLNRITSWHNKQTRELDVSTHFNAYNGSAQGTEVLYVTQSELAAKMSKAIAAAGPFTNRGGKYRSDLAFLNKTNKPAILLEICFCDNTSDSNKFTANFESVCNAIVTTLGGVAPPERPLPPQPEFPDSVLFTANGKCSSFGGPADTGVSPSEGLAFVYELDDAPHLFLTEQPPGTTGLARRLDPDVFYVACRWDYDVTPKTMLRDQTRKALVRFRGQEVLAYPADWGPHTDTGRVADLSPGLLAVLGAKTDDVVEVIYPAPQED